MRFREGMRRICIVFWGVVSAGIFREYGESYPHGWTAGSVITAVEYIIVWTAGFWLFCVVVRWVWTGFAGPERAE